MSIRASSPEQIKGNIKVTSSDGTHTMKTTMELAGKWLGADCGKIAPDDDDEE
jgi:hypothetical protein